MKPIHSISALILSLAALGACGHSSSPVAIDPNAADEVLFQEGLAAYNAVDYPTALSKFGELLTTFPDSPRHDNSGYLIGRSHYAQNSFPESLTAMTDMLALHADSKFAGSALYFRGRDRFKLAGLPIPEDDYPVAVADFENAISTDPTGTYADNATYYVGRTQFQQGNFAQAITALADVEGAYPDSSYVDNALYYTGRSQFELGQFTDAIASFDLVLQDTASTLGDNARYRRGRANYAIPDFAAALSDFKDIETTYSGSIFEDNALYYEIRVNVDQASCAAASTVLSTLQSRFPASSYIGRAQNYMTGNGC